MDNTKEGRKNYLPPAQYQYHASNGMISSIVAQSTELKMNSSLKPCGIILSFIHYTVGDASSSSSMWLFCQWNGTKQSNLETASGLMSSIRPTTWNMNKDVFVYFISPRWIIPNSRRGMDAKLQTAVTC